jgi:DNA-binding CsgD family transcriptional regulator
MRMVFTGDPGHNNQAFAPLKLRCASPSNAHGLGKGTLGTGPKRIVPIVRQTITASSDSPGLLLLDSSLEPIYASEEAVSILCYPESPRKKGHLDSFLLRRIGPLLPKQDDSSRSIVPGEFISGKRRYEARVFKLKPRLGGGLRLILAVMLQRSHGAPMEVIGAAQKFHLTQRETEALDLLMHGCNTKEIAEQMDISPNTAKTFLRSIMFKTKARDRSGILVKILQFSKGMTP